MEKTATLNVRINPSVKADAENILKKLGIPMATAVDMFLRQISLTGSIPFAIKLPQALLSVNADDMNNEELKAKLIQGLNETRIGQVEDAKSAFEKFRKARQ